MNRLLQVLVVAIFASSMFFFAMAAGRAAEAPGVTAYLLTFKIINNIPFIVPLTPPRAESAAESLKGTASQVSYVSIPGIATEAECIRLAEAMLTDPIKLYACHAYQMAH